MCASPGLVLSRGGQYLCSAPRYWLRSVLLAVTLLLATFTNPFVHHGVSTVRRTSAYPCVVRRMTRMKQLVFSEMALGTMTKLNDDERLAGQ